MSRREPDHSCLRYLNRSGQRNVEFKVWRDLDCIRWWDLYSSNWKELDRLGDLNGSFCLNLILERPGKQALKEH
ncbi:hypothetical protein DPMN_033923 [Dreissena polymorpha]|uniref:Uncharacterized protein n=1 Tax=Dreissena polymorpha TaxID=45954 RepID=A0A9D4M977_DREPO|nr:hypothetical protein DPMN_033923 [Dreissena polymorpha]